VIPRQLGLSLCNASHPRPFISGPYRGAIPAGIQ
jgi:hypothetical protein